MTHVCKDMFNICLEGIKRDEIVATCEAGDYVGSTDHGLVNTTHTIQGRDVRFVPRPQNKTRIRTAASSRPAELGEVRISTLFILVLAQVLALLGVLAVTHTDSRKDVTVISDASRRITTTTSTTIPTTTTAITHTARPRASRGATRPRYSLTTLPDGSPCPWRDKSYCWSGNVWHVLSACEAGMDPRNTKAAPNYWGAFQFSLSTWHSIGESGNPIDYDWDHQQRAAERLQQRSGWGQWPSCSRKLGLR